MANNKKRSNAAMGTDAAAAVGPHCPNRPTFNSEGFMFCFHYINFKTFINQVIIYLSLNQIILRGLLLASRVVENIPWFRPAISVEQLMNTTTTCLLAQFLAQLKSTMNSTMSFKTTTSQNTI